MCMILQLETWIHQTKADISIFSAQKCSSPERPGPYLDVVDMRHQQPPQCPISYGHIVYTVMSEQVTRRSQ